MYACCECMDDMMHYVALMRISLPTGLAFPEFCRMQVNRRNKNMRQNVILHYETNQKKQRNYSSILLPLRYRCSLSRTYLSIVLWSGNYANIMDERKQYVWYSNNNKKFKNDDYESLA